MRLFGKARQPQEIGVVRGDGWRLLHERMIDAIENDGFVFIVVAGERGRGKSSLALNMAEKILGSREAVLRAIVFTVDDFEQVVEKEPSLKARDGRAKLVLWDDIGVHFSSYKWFAANQRQKMIDFLENFQSVREDVAVFIATVVELDMLPPKLRNAANYVVDTHKRGWGKVYGYSRILWLKKWKYVGEIAWSKADPWLYEQYRELKRKAHRARRKARVITYTKLVKAYAEVVKTLYDRGELDEETLYGLGIVDKDKRLTRFGHLVLKRAGLEPEQVLEVVEQ